MLVHTRENVNTDDQYIYLTCTKMLQERMVTLPEHMSSPQFFFIVSEVRVIQITILRFLVPCCDLHYD